MIADGVVAMEGNGPMHGHARDLGCLVFADDPVAADALCCELMGIARESIRHLVLGANLGNHSPADWLRCGEMHEALQQRFRASPSP
ncbi:MAG: DUF362 domain-containing protein [Bryobacterales bacterium]|nr:DUF362 domain-containing protein [Bryobacterales bacterium]